MTSLSPSNGSSGQLPLLDAEDPRVKLEIVELWKQINTAIDAIRPGISSGQSGAVFLALREIRDASVVALNRKFNGPTRIKENQQAFKANWRELKASGQLPEHVDKAIETLDLPLSGDGWAHPTATTEAGEVLQLDDVPQRALVALVRYAVQETLGESSVLQYEGRLRGAIALLRAPEHGPDKSPPFALAKGTHAIGNLNEWLESGNLAAAASRGITVFVGPRAIRTEHLLGSLQFGTGILEAVDRAPEDIQSFFEALVTDDSRTAGRSSNVVRRMHREDVTHVPTAPQPSAPMDPLVQLQLALLELAQRTTVSFSQSLSRSMTPIYAWESLDAVIEGDQLVGLVADFNAVCHTLKQHRQVLGGYPLLGAKGMLKRFETMEEQARQRTDNGRLSLGGSELEWLTDVLWHTLTFDSPTYPLGDELALQVSLVHDSAQGMPKRSPRRRLDPASAVARFDYVEFVDTVKDCVARGLPTADDAPADSLFGAVAESQFRDFLDWSTRASNRPLPIALSSTFDIEMERALWRSGKGAFHVGIPVLVNEELTDANGTVTERVRLRWIIGTFDPSAAGSSYVDLLRPNKGWRWAEDCTKQGRGLEVSPDLQGPLVLKISGSPLHDIADVASPSTGLGRGELKGIFHAVVLGEFDVMQYMRLDTYTFDARRWGGIEPQQGLPSWAVQQLANRDRAWFLVGHQLDDWNARMQLFVNVTRTGTDSRNRLFAVSEVWDEHRQGFLESLGVMRLTGELRVLAEALEAYAGRRS